MSFLVKHVRLHSLYLLYKTTWPRALVLFDMYTDVIVAISLLTVNEPIFFMISCVLLISPFLLVWVASLRFVQKWVSSVSNVRGAGKNKTQVTQDKNDQDKQDKNKNSKCLQRCIDFFVYLYMFPPIGCLIIFGYEIIWVITDILNGFIAFFKGNLIIETESNEYKALKV